MLRIALAGIAAVTCLFAAVSAVAHHSVAAEFDTDRQGELRGEITQVWFTNPHVRYRLHVTNADGSTEDWELQAGNVTNLRRVNWNADSIRVGDVVTVSGQLGRRGAKKLLIRDLETADGRHFPPRSNAERRPDRNAVNASADKDYTYSAAADDYPIDITGGWRNSYKWHVTVDDLEPKPIPFTAEGRRIFEATEPWHDPSLRCVAPGLPRIFGAPYNMDIVDAGTHYLMVYIEHNTPRRVWMDGRTPPEDTPPTPMGFSVGHWEGDELVIETTHLSAGWLDGSGLPMSGDGTRIVERYTFSDDRLTMDRVMTIYDPYYTEPLVRRRASARDDELDLTEQAPCDPDSYYRDLAAAGRLDAHFSR
ncbi:MAG TPA: DUF6152 family protein [Gammaproteobacteria bacterium]